MSLEKFDIWNGVFTSFKDTQCVEEVFDDETWQKSQVLKVSEQMEKLKSQKTIPPLAMTSDYPLAPILSGLLKKGHKTTLLDFGGGLGHTFLHLKACLPNIDSIDYHIVDTPNSCNTGSELLKEFSNVKFHSSLETVPKQLDVIHIGSTLQYIEDWKSFLSMLSEFKANDFILSDLMAGDIPTFVSKQFYYGKYIPTWFWNVDEVIEHLSTNNYELMFKSNYLGQFLGEKQDLPMENLPKENRLKNACHLAFKLS